MAGPHGPSFHVAVASPVHDLPAQVKLAAALGFVGAVVSVPPEAVWAFAVLALVLVGVAVAAHVPPLAIVRRWAVAAPFLAVIPVVAVVSQGERVGFGLLSVSQPGLWSAWNIAAKSLLGLSTSLLLLATTRPTDLVGGLDRLRVPPVFSATAGFMLRYLQLALDDARRLRLARLARGDDPRWLWQARGVAATAGTLFVRTYERGERVHRSMVARGYRGRLPAVGVPAGAGQWVVGACLPAIGFVVALAAWAGQR